MDIAGTHERSRKRARVGSAGDSSVVEASVHSTDVNNSAAPPDAVQHAFQRLVALPHARTATSRHCAIAWHVDLLAHRVHGHATWYIEPALAAAGVIQLHFYGDRLSAAKLNGVGCTIDRRETQATLSRLAPQMGALTAAATVAAARAACAKGNVTLTAAATAPVSTGSTESLHQAVLELEFDCEASAGGLRFCEDAGGRPFIYTRGWSFDALCDDLSFATAAFPWVGSHSDRATASLSCCLLNVPPSGILPAAGTSGSEPVRGVTALTAGMSLASASTPSGLCVYSILDAPVTVHAIGFVAGPLTVVQSHAPPAGDAASSAAVPPPRASQLYTSSYSSLSTATLSVHADSMTAAELPAFTRSFIGLDAPWGATRHVLLPPHVACSRSRMLSTVTGLTLPAMVSEGADPALDVSTLAGIALYPEAALRRPGSIDVDDCTTYMAAVGHVASWLPSLLSPSSAAHAWWLSGAIMHVVNQYTRAARGEGEYRVRVARASEAVAVMEDMYPHLAPLAPRGVHAWTPFGSPHRTEHLVTKSAAVIHMLGVAVGESALQRSLRSLLHAAVPSARVDAASGAAAPSTVAGHITSALSSPMLLSVPSEGAAVPPPMDGFGPSLMAVHSSTSVTSPSLGHRMSSDSVGDAGPTAGKAKTDLNTQDFLAHVSAHTRDAYVARKLLATFADNWLYSNGVPQLIVGLHHNNKANALEVIVEQVLRPGTRVYVGPLTVHAMERREDDGELETWMYHMEVTDIRSTMTIPSHSRVKRRLGDKLTALMDKRKRARKEAGAPPAPGMAMLTPATPAVAVAAHVPDLHAYLPEEVNDTPVETVLIDPHLGILKRLRLVCAPVLHVATLVHVTDTCAQLAAVAALGSYGCGDALYTPGPNTRVAAPPQTVPHIGHARASADDVQGLLQLDTSSSLSRAGLLIQPHNVLFPPLLLFSLLCDVEPLQRSQASDTRRGVSRVAPLHLPWRLRAAAAHALAHWTGGHLPMHGKGGHRRHGSYAGTVALIAAYRRHFCTASQIDAHVFPVVTPAAPLPAEDSYSGFAASAILGRDFATLGDVAHAEALAFARHSVSLTAVDSWAASDVVLQQQLFAAIASVRDADGRACDVCVEFLVAALRAWGSVTASRWDTRPALTSMCVAVTSAILSGTSPRRTAASVGANAGRHAQAAAVVMRRVLAMFLLQLHTQSGATSDVPGSVHVLMAAMNSSAPTGDVTSRSDDAACAAACMTCLSLLEARHLIPAAILPRLRSYLLPRHPTAGFTIPSELRLAAFVASVRVFLSTSPRATLVADDPATTAPAAVTDTWYAAAHALIRTAFDGAAQRSRLLDASSAELQRAMQSALADMHFRSDMAHAPTALPILLNESVQQALKEDLTRAFELRSRQRNVSLADGGVGAISSMATTVFDPSSPEDVIFDAGLYDASEKAPVSRYERAPAGMMRHAPAAYGVLWPLRDPHASIVLDASASSDSGPRAVRVAQLVNDAASVILRGMTWPSHGPVSADAAYACMHSIWGGASPLNESLAPKVSANATPSTEAASAVSAISALLPDLTASRRAFLHLLRANMRERMLSISARLAHAQTVADATQYLLAQQASASTAVARPSEEVRKAAPVRAPTAAKPGQPSTAAVAAPIARAGVPPPVVTVTEELNIGGGSLAKSAAPGASAAASARALPTPSPSSAGARPPAGKTPSAAAAARPPAPKRRSVFVDDDDDDDD